VSPLVISVIGVVAFLILISQAVPIAFAFALVGFMGLFLLRGFDTGLFILGNSPFTWASTSSLIPMPLFILMGHFAFHAGISSDLYVAAHKWVGRFPGGLALATTLACTGFAACSGSSMAGAATMGAIAYPEMQGFKYDRRMSTACIAAGGTLAALIPPSGGFIIYGFLTGTSIAELFIAGIFPGFLLAGLFLAAIYIMCQRNPRLGPRGPSYPWKEMIKSLKGVWGMLLLFLLVIFGLYFGVFTPSEAGAIGAFGAFAIAVARRRLTFSSLFTAVKGSLQITCFVFTLLIGAMIFNTFLSVSGFTTVLAGWVTALPLSPYIILICILIIYIPLGMIMDVLAMIVLTIPVVFPIIVNLGFDPIWFGVLITAMSEMALITPPVGLNVYVVSGVTKVPLEEVFRGVFPFVAMMAVCVVILVAFPQISLFLPGMMK
jgi:C4-dicarboxylate transporter DctM subunit